jgi:hypothetical protein
LWLKRGREEPAPPVRVPLTPVAVEVSFAMTHLLSRTDVRIGLGVAVLVGVVGAAAFLLGGSDTVRALGRGLNIAVVAPVEPEVLPGETMEVGALNDGFDRAALERAAEQPTDDTWLPEPAWIGDERLGDPTPRMPMPTPVNDTRVIEVQPPRTDPLADGSRAFGFDVPRPDYAAERTARLNRMAAAESATAAPANEDADPSQYSSE